MKAVLLDELITQIFSVETGTGETLSVTWNRDTHTEEVDSLVHVPEFEVADQDGELLDKGCQDWNEAVEAVKKWGES